MCGVIALRALGQRQTMMIILPNKKPLSMKIGWQVAPLRIGDGHRSVHCLTFGSKLCRDPLMSTAACQRTLNCPNLAHNLDIVKCAQQIHEWNSRPELEKCPQALGA